MKKIRILFALALFFISCLIFPSESSAQIPEFHTATTLIIEDKEATDSDLLSLTDKPLTLTRSKVPYDDKLYGVAIENPTMVYRTMNTLPVIRSGIACVHVTTINGDIITGDYVTSSQIPGYGMKATEYNGFVAGIALADFKKEDAVEMDFENKKIYAGRVCINVGIGPATPVKIQAAGGLFGTLKFIVTSFLMNLSTSKDASKIVRYFLAALVAIATLVLNFMTFGRNITKGIESIGRNPLAKVPIQTMIILNIILIAVVTVGGIVISLVIISL